jgi:hypothetical protein
VVAATKVIAIVVAVIWVIDVVVAANEFVVVAVMYPN